MEKAEPMRPGFYWYFDADCEPEVVQISADGEVYFCHEEGFYFLPTTGKTRFVVHGRFVGPISPPQDETEGITL